MPIDEQGARPGRYMVIPRTAIFLREGDAFLLLKGASNRRIWPGKYNGVGGHVDRGEDVLSSARRELLEETGLEGDLWLCGTILVDAGEIGVGLYVFTGSVSGGLLRTSQEGEAEWIDCARIPSLPTVEDVPILLERIRRMHRGDAPFSARSSYDAAGKLSIVFSA